jgi:hypothetical protein
MGEIRDQLADHRKKDVRTEARATHLAYGYLKGRTYVRIEHPNSTTPPKDRVERMVKKYGTKELVDGLSSWYPV